MHRGSWVAVILALVVSAAAAGEYDIAIREPLNHRWTCEWVTVPFSMEKGACHRDSVRLAGPGGSLPVQLADLELWPGSDHVKTGTLAFVVGELAPLATNRYTVTYGPSAASAQAPETDLVIKQEPDRVEVTGRLFGTRLLLGKRTYDKPLPAADVPGPLLGMRLGDGTWFGGSRLYGDTPIAGYDARLVESGPVFVRVECLYRYADGNTNRVAIQFNSQGNRLYFETGVERESLTNGWDLLLAGLPPLAFQFMPEQGTQQPSVSPIKGWRERAVADYPAGLISRLVAWGDWFNEYTQTTLFLAFLDTRPKAAPAPGDPAPPVPVVAEDAPDGRELVIRRLDAGAWVTPPASPQDRDKADIPLMKAADGSLFLRMCNKAGARTWTVGENPSYRAKLQRVMRSSNVMQDELEDLDVVRQMVLDWPEGDARHPSLFLDPADFQEALTRNPDVRKSLLNVEKLREMLGSYVFFDTMRQGAEVICLYDAIIDSDLISPAEKRLFRAQMAYLAYRLASPANWSTERGYNSGNPNMTVAHSVNQGLAACVLSDHPMARTWNALPSRNMNQWMDRLDAAGYWPESSGYARVSESHFVNYAIAAQRAGLQDFLSDARFKRMVLYFERTLTPPDPQRLMKDGVKPRVSPPHGRGGNGNSVGLGGAVAKATAKLDPDLSRILQWSYAATGFSPFGNESMAGYELLRTDRSLPTQRPDWRSEYLPNVGALFRGGVGEPEENYLLLVMKYATNPDGEIWPSEVGALTLWFEHGRPLARVFPAGSAYPYLHGLMLNRVMLATNYEPGKQTPAGYTGQEERTGLALLPRLDYAAHRYQWREPWSGVLPAPPPAVHAFPVVKREGVLGTNGVTWQRQALYVRDAWFAGKNYLVLRDTVSQDQPTQWQFWTLSKGLTSVDGAAAASGEAAPAAAAEPMAMPEPILPAPVELTGNRFLAKGQFGLDLEYFIASPTDTPRHTMRHSYAAPQSGAVAGFQCDQDLLHLQLTGKGVYFVALVPRESGEPAPVFEKSADNTIIKVHGTFGTDHVFVSAAARESALGDISFSGTAGVVQDRTNGLAIALGAAGSVRCRDFGVTASEPVCLQVAGKTMTISLPAGHATATVTVTAPGGWSLIPKYKDIGLSSPRKSVLEFEVPSGETEFELSGF